MTEQELMTATGGRLFLVGGAVRDLLMGKVASDRDYVLTGVHLSDMTIPKIAGKDFPVFLMEINGAKAEVAMARKERKIAEGYAGFEFYTDPAITIEEDLFRRDLTINAMAIDLTDGTLIDPYGGRKDLAEGILRHTSEAFAEDPLRVYRISRFAAKFGYRIHEDTKKLMVKLKPELAALTPERVGIELCKALVCSFPDKFFTSLEGLLNIHFPEIEALKVPDKHDDTAFLHTLACLYRGRNLYERWGLLVHDLGKGLSPDPPAHHGHEDHTHLIDQLGDRLKLPKKLIAFGKEVMSTHMKLKKLDEMRPGKLFKLIKNRSIFKLMKLSYLESYGRYDKQAYRRHVALAKLILRIQKEVTGQVLLDRGILPDQNFGQKLLQERIREFKRRKNAG